MSIDTLPTGTGDAGKTLADMRTGKASFGMRPDRIWPRLTWCALGIVLALVAGAVLRLVEPGQVLFKFDEATASSQVAHMLETGVPAPVATTASIGGAFPPLFDYLMLPPYLVSHSPVLATAYVALLNIVTLVLTAALVWRYAGGRAALFTTMLYAFSPWAVVYSRKIWDPYLLPLFAVLALWGLLLLAVERRSWGGALFLGAWLWLIQIHPIAIVTGPVGFAVLALCWRRLRPLSMLLALAIGILPLLPYIPYERLDHWQDVLSFVYAFLAPGYWELIALLFPVQNATGLGANELQGVPLTQFLHPVALAGFLAVIGTALLVIGHAGALFGALRLRWQTASAGPPTSVYLVPLLWVVEGIVLTIHSGAWLVSHYFLALLPAIFMATGVGLDRLCRALQPLGQRLTTTGIVGYGLLSSLPLLALYAYLPTPAAAGLQYAGATMAVTQAVERLLPSGAVNYVAQDSDSAAALAFELSPRYQVAVTGAGWALLATAPRQVVIGSPNETIVAQLLPPGEPPAAQLTFAGGAAPQDVALLQQAEPDQPFGRLLPLDVTLANGVRYLGWGATQPGSGLLRVTLGWRIVSAAASSADFAPYVHLMQGDRMLTQHDGISYMSARWQQGQILYAWFDLPLPPALAPGTYQLRTGMYTRPDVRRVPRLGPTGPEDGEFALGTVTLPLSR